MNKIWLGMVAGLSAMQVYTATPAKVLKRDYLKKQISACMQELMQKLKQAGKNIKNENIQKQILHACVYWRRQGYDPVEIAQNVEIKI